MFRMDESQNPGKVETDKSKGNEKKDENISTPKSATPSSSTSSTPVFSIGDNLDEKIQKIAMKGNSSKKLATSNKRISDSNLLETGGNGVNQIQASASNQLTNQPLNVTSSGSGTVAEIQHVMSIEILSDDCLLLVFRYLSIVDRIKIERVSQRWNDLAKSSWSQVKQLDSNPPSWGFRPRGFLSDEQKKINAKELKRVLKRCGKFLESIDATKIYYDLYNGRKKVEKKISLYVASCVASYCPDIKSLKIVLLGVDTLKKLAKNCKNIDELCIMHVDYVEDIELSDFLSNYKNLKILKLPIFKDGSFLLNLSLLEALEVERYLDTSKLQYLVNALKKMSNLKVIKLSFLHQQTNNVIVALKNCSNLEKIYLRTDHCYNHPDIENQFGLLLKNNQKLETLSLRFFNLTGKCFIYLNPECFKELRFDRCKNLNFAFFNKNLKIFNELCKFEYINSEISVDNYEELMKFISSLENLKLLNLKIESPINDLSLSDNFNLLSTLTNLEELILEGYLKNKFDCFKIVGKHFKNLKTVRLSIHDNVYDAQLKEITSLPKLEELSLSFLGVITDSGFCKMINLKKLELRYCGNLETDCLKKILAESEKLEYLYTRNCKKLNRINFVLFANEVTKQRTNNIILYIHRYISDNFRILRKVKKSEFLEFTDILTEKEF